MLALPFAPSLGTAQAVLRRSQHGSVSQTVNSTQISLTYNRPVARGRTLFGGVVRLRWPWNPGADTATQIAFSRDVAIAGQPLPAGSYTLWAIPDTAEWTVIFSTATDVWHVPYPTGQDALRVTIVPTTGDHMETLAFHFPVVGPSSATLRLHWGATVIDIPIAVEAELEPFGAGLD
ncbi:MAG: DUF2911 domain-containing protein [Gemmatimonadales bacterium]|nr:DUF2911 domain-containing protein [Gemmatimonadales bacterium]